MEESFETIFDSVNEAGKSLINFRAIVIVIVTIILTILVMKIINNVSAWFIKKNLSHSENIKESEKLIIYKRAETWMNVILSIVQIVVIIFAVTVAWNLISPSSAPLAVIGAGAFFLVVANGTINPLLRDYTSGSVMILEKWFGVGDMIQVEPFTNVQGIVEKLTLRSTKIRSLSGEVTWLHNQYIQGVRVRYRGSTTIALDVFVNHKEKAISLLEGIIEIIPKGPLMVIDGLQMTEVENINEKMWRIELSGRTVPGREWLIENFAAEAIKDADKLNEGKDKIIVYGPIARYVDTAAERRFKRVVK